MKGLSTLETISYHQQQLMDEIQGASKSSKDFDKISEIEDHLTTLIKELYLLPISTSMWVKILSPQNFHECIVFSGEEQNKSQDVISKKSFVRQLDMHVDHAVENHKASLEAFDEFKGMSSVITPCDQHEKQFNYFYFLGNIAKSNNDFLCGAKAIEDTICKARNLYLEHSSVPKQFCDKLDTWYAIKSKSQNVN
jgi:hypothetical protein